MMVWERNIKQFKNNSNAITLFNSNNSFTLKGLALVCNYLQEDSNFAVVAEEPLELDKYFALAEVS